MDRYRQLLDIFSGDISLSDFLLTVLTSKQYQNHPSAINVMAATPQLLSAMLKISHSGVSGWAHNIVGMQCVQELRDLGSGEHSWQFNALHASVEHIESFRIELIAHEIESEAPRLWRFLDVLLASPRQSNTSGMSVVEGHDVRDDNDEDSEYWDQVDDVEGIIEGVTGTYVTRAARLASRRNAIINLRKVVAVSLLKKTTNQRSNSLSGMLGIFLHSTHAPEKVVETMARMGLSISVDAIHDAIQSLSAQSTRALHKLGKTLLTAYAYDNFDVNLKVSISKQECLSNFLLPQARSSAKNLFSPCTNLSKCWDLGLGGL